MSLLLSSTNQPIVSLRRQRYSKPCPRGCGRRCDRSAKQCRVCLEERYRQIHGGDVTQPQLESQRQIDTAERAGYCLEGDYCARWHCRLCDGYWLGRINEHDCPVRKENA